MASSSYTQVKRDRELRELLTSLFSTDELRHFLVEIQEDEVHKAIVWVGSQEQVVLSAVETLKRRGQINGEFFESLAKARPHRSETIQRVREVWVFVELAREQVWASRYRLVCEVGKGGYGLVWKAYDMHEEKHVALKILHQHQANDRGVLLRFRRGASILNDASRRPNYSIVRALSSAMYEGMWVYYVMEFVAGRGLDKEIGQTPRIELLRMLLRMGPAIEQLHRANLIHRDIKPSNILVTSDRQGVLVDFDLVSGDEFDTSTKMIAGSRRFCPPEAITYGRSPAYDVYSFARTVEEVLRGREPTAVEIAAGTVESLDVPDNVKTVLWAATVEDSAIRTQSIGAFCQELNAAYAANRAPPAPTASVPAVPEPTAPKPRGWGRRRWAVMVGSVIVLTIVAVVAVWWGAAEEPTRDEDVPPKPPMARSSEPAVVPPAEQTTPDENGPKYSWWCLCYREWTEEGAVVSTGCRKSKQVCNNVRKQINAENQKLLVMGSLIRPCTNLEGKWTHPSKAFKDEGPYQTDWTTSESKDGGFQRYGACVIEKRAKNTLETDFLKYESLAEWAPGQTEAADPTKQAGDVAYLEFDVVITYEARETKRVVTAIEATGRDATTAKGAHIGMSRKDCLDLYDPNRKASTADKLHLSNEGRELTFWFDKGKVARIRLARATVAPG